MRVRALRWLVAMMVVGGVVSTALGDDIVPPVWRGDPASTFQEWDFLTDANPASPEAGTLTNPYGSPTATISLGFLAAGYLGEFEGRDGIWDIAQGPPTSTGCITLEIPNSSITGPGTYKDVLVQVTYYLDPSDVPVVDVVGGTLTDSGSQLVDDVSGPGAWWLDWSLWRIEPNPFSETITISGNADWGSTIDQIVVDTVCVPEPATAALVILGCASLLGRKRRGAERRG